MDARGTGRAGNAGRVRCHPAVRRGAGCAFRASSRGERDAAGRTRDRWTGSNQRPGDQRTCDRWARGRRAAR
jgi:hypothetical protein